MPIWNFEDWADIKDNAKRIVPRINDKVSISVDKKFLYINDIAMPTGPGTTGMLMLSDSMGRLNWVSADNVGVGATGMQGPTGAYGGPPGATGAQGTMGETGLGNFYQQSGFSGSTLVPALMWNFQDESFYGFVTGLGGKWIQVSGGALVGATGLRGATGSQGLVGATGAYGGPPGATGVQGATGVGGSGTSNVEILGTTGSQTYPGGMTTTIGGLSFPIKNNKRYLVDGFLMWAGQGAHKIGVSGPSVTSISIGYQRDPNLYDMYVGYTGVYETIRNNSVGSYANFKMNILSGSATGMLSFFLTPASGTVATSNLCQLTIKEI